MKITCPSCETNFSVPEAALGTRGRTLRCARCGHKWHQLPPYVEDEVPLEMPAKAPPRKAAPSARPSVFEPPVEDKEFEDNAGSGLPGFNLNFGGDGASFSFGSSGGADSYSDNLEEEDPSGPPEEVEDPFAHIAELMGASPEPIPDVFASPPPKPKPRRKGGAGLWVLVIMILLGAAGFGLYQLQEIVVDLIPGSAQVYEELGLRSEVVGAGLIFRNYSSERMVQENSEVLVVRGVIANSTDAIKEIPLLRLALYNDKTLLQKKIISPPQQALDARGSVGFRITLEQPDPSANRFEVTFASARGPEAEPTMPAPQHETQAPMPPEPPAAASAPAPLAPAPAAQPAHAPAAPAHK